MRTTIKMQFDPQIAKNIGVEEAIMFSNIEFWVEHNRANKKHFHDKKYWTYNTQEAFSKLFPFWTRRQIQRILKKLEESKYIVSTPKYNKHKYDKTKWYTTHAPNSAKPSTKRCEAKHQTVQPIPDSKHRLKNTDKISIAKSNDFADSRTIVSLITEFKQINPSYQLFYNNKTQRACIERLLKKYGENKIRNTIKALSGIINKRYAPRITTPYQLERKLGDLIVYYKQNVLGKGKSHVII